MHFFLDIIKKNVKILQMEYIKDYKMFIKKVEKGSFPKAIFIGGEEYYWKREAVVFLRERIKDTKLYFADELDESAVAKMFTPKLFAKKTVPIIYNSDIFTGKAKKGLFQTIIAEIQKKESSGISAVFVFRTPEEAGVKNIYAFPRDIRKFIPQNLKFPYWIAMFWKYHTEQERIKMEDWVQGIFKNVGYNITDDAKKYLIDIFGMNHSYIKNEIDKIISFHPENNVINLNTIKLIGGGFRENVAYNLPFSIAKGDIKSALRLLKNALLYKRREESLTKNLFDFFKKLYILKIYQNMGEDLYRVMKEKLHVPFYLKNTYITVLNLISFDFLKDTLSVIVQREKEIKMGISKEEWLYTLITFLTERRKQYG